jgi:hypothetical protein
MKPFPYPRKVLSERPGAVKGAPLLGAAMRTLDGEDRSNMIIDCCINNAIMVQETSSCAKTEG